MTDPQVVTDIVSWIESHDKTVDLIKWVVIGLAAWLVGAFRFIRTKLKRPALEIEELTSRCVWEDLGEIDGNGNNVRVIFLIEAGVTNPTTAPIVVRNFTLSIKRQKRWPLWHRELNPATLPTRVRLTVGGITKLLKNWFSNFPDGPETLTLSGKIEPRDFQSGFLLFVSVSWGNMVPRSLNGSIPVRLRARLTTGETLTAKAKVIQMDDHSIFEGMVPGVLEHAGNRSTWNILRERS